MLMLYVNSSLSLLLSQVLSLYWPTGQLHVFAYHCVCERIQVHRYAVYILHCMYSYIMYYSLYRYRCKAIARGGSLESRNRLLSGRCVYLLSIYIIIALYCITHIYAFSHTILDYTSYFNDLYTGFVMCLAASIIIYEYDRSERKNIGKYTLYNILQYLCKV